MYELSIVELELISGAGPIADVTTGMGGAIGGGIGNLAGKAGGGTVGGILGSPFGPGGTIVGVAAGQQYGGRVGSVIGVGAGSAIGGMLGANDILAIISTKSKHKLMTRYFHNYVL
ncbi:hypothetical protein, partial [Kingella negevensis]